MRIGKTSLSLLFVAAFVVAFTAAVLWLNYNDHDVSEALIAGVFSLATGECGLLAWLKRGERADTGNIEG